MDAKTGFFWCTEGYFGISAPDIGAPEHEVVGYVLRLIVLGDALAAKVCVKEDTDRIIGDLEAKVLWIFI